MWEGGGMIPDPGSDCSEVAGEAALVAPNQYCGYCGHILVDGDTECPAQVSCRSSGVILQFKVPCSGCNTAYVYGNEEDAEGKKCDICQTPLNVVEGEYILPRSSRAW